MRLRAYLTATGESARAFAVRSGVPHRSVLNVLERGTCTATTALAIIRASHEHPTPGGGTIALEDLVVEDDAEGDAA